MSRSSLLVPSLLVGLLVLPGCGPTTREAGAAVLLASGAIIVSSHLLVWALWRLFRGPAPGPFGWPAIAVLSLAATAAGALTLIAMPDTERPLGWLGTAYCLAGTSYVSLHVVSFVGWLMRRPEDAPRLSHLVPAFFFLGPALPMALGGDLGAVGELALGLWVIPGYAGLIAGPVYLVALIGVGLWGKRRAVSLAFLKFSARGTWPGGSSFGGRERL